MSTLIGKVDAHLTLPLPKSEYGNTVLELEFKLLESDPNVNHGNGEEESPNKHSIAELV
jgi:hypothetical protein